MSIDRDLRNDESQIGWDVFISYASEDRQAVAAPLANALATSGLRVWFDQFEIRLGDSLFASISEGIRFSSYGIVILSPDFLAKGWTQRELRGLFSLSTIEKRNSIIPIWHKMTAADIAEYSPLLSDIKAARWEDGIDVVVSQILGVLSLEKDGHVIPVSLLISADIRRALSKLDYPDLVKNIIRSHGSDTVFDSLSEIALDIDQSPWIRIRALELLASEGAIARLNWPEFLQQPISEVLEGAITFVTKSDYTLSKTQVNLLFNNPALPRKSTGNIGEMIRAFIAKGTGFSSEIFLPVSQSQSWEVKYNCVKAIIQIDDETSISTLWAFSSMSYWQARRRIIEYLVKRHESGRLILKDRSIALDILRRISTDGKTDEGTRVMKLAKKALHTLG